MKCIPYSTAVKDGRVITLDKKLPFQLRHLFSTDENKIYGYTYGIICDIAAISFYKPGPDTAPQSMYALMSSSYLGAMLSSNHALQYVSYPTQVSVTPSR